LSNFLKERNQSLLKWISKVKYRVHGSTERHKARLVAKGFTQREGVHYHETFSPVVKFNTVDCMVSIAVIRGWKIQQMDANNVFFQGDLHEEVHMKIPLGLPFDSPSLVCRLRKSLYGLEKASANDMQNYLIPYNQRCIQNYLILYNQRGIHILQMITLCFSRRSMVKLLSCLYMLMPC